MRKVGEKKVYRVSFDLPDRKKRNHCDNERSVEPCAVSENSTIKKIRGSKKKKKKKEIGQFLFFVQNVFIKLLKFPKRAKSCRQEFYGNYEHEALKIENPT